MRDNQQNTLKYFFYGIIVLGIFQEITSIRSSPTPTTQHMHTQHTERQDPPQSDQQSNHHHHHSQNHYEPQQQTHKNTAFSDQEQSNLHLNILYCKSCSYASTFEQIKNHFSLQFPMMTVTGSEYPLPPLQKTISTVLSYAQYGLIGVGLLGDRVGFIAQNPLYQRIRANKMMYLMGGYLFINMAQNMVSSSGAFEVYLNNRLIFSKKQTNRMPTAFEIQSLIK